jgi:hypothetical protein
MNQYQTRVQCIKSSGYIKPPPPYVLYCALNSAPKGAGEKRKGEEKEKEKNPPNKITTPIINELRLHTTTLTVKLRKAPELKESYHYARTKLGETDGRGNNVHVLLRLPENTIVPKHYSMKTKVERAHWISDKPIFRKLMEHIEIDQHHITFPLQQHTHTPTRHPRRQGRRGQHIATGRPSHLNLWVENFAEWSRDGLAQQDLDEIHSAVLQAVYQFWKPHLAYESVMRARVSLRATPKPAV